jgi:hypothetical protein
VSGTFITGVGDFSSTKKKMDPDDTPTQSGHEPTYPTLKTTGLKTTGLTDAETVNPVVVDDRTADDRPVETTDDDFVEVYRVDDFENNENDQDRDYESTDDEEDDSNDNDFQPVDGELCLDTSQQQFYQQFMLGLDADPKSRKVARKYAAKHLAIGRKYYLVENTTGRYAKDMKDKPITNGSCNYAIMSEDGTTVEKHGETMKGKQRQGKYVKEKSLDPKRFKKVFDQDNIPVEAGKEFEENYQAYLYEMSTNPEVPLFVRLFHQQLGEHCGDRLGAKGVLWNALIEKGLCFEKNLPNPFEVLMFQQTVVDALFRELETYTNKAVVEALADLLEHAGLADTQTRNDITRCFFHAVMSWKVGHTGLSSKVCSTLGLVRDSTKMSDPINFSAIPDAKTTQEVFNTSNYTKEDKANGRDHVRSIIRKLLAAEFGLVFLDSNDLCFLDDDSFSKSVIEFLEEEFGFALGLAMLFGEIHIFLDSTKLRVVVVNRPFCASQDRRQPLTVKIRRAFSEAVCNNMARLFRGDDLIDPSMDTFNPIYALLSMQKFQKGLHLGGRRAAAAYRNFTTDKNTNAFLLNSINKSPSSDYPVSYNLRHKIYRKDLPPVKRPLNTHVVFQARHILTDATEQFFRNTCLLIMELLKQNNAVPSTQTARWNLLIKNHVKENSELYHKLQETRLQIKKETTNAGNRTKGDGRGNNQDDTKRNNDEMDELIAVYGPYGTKAGEKFWIRAKRKLERPPDGTLCSDGKTIFPGKYEKGVESFAYWTLDGRCKLTRPGRAKGVVNDAPKHNVVQKTMYPYVSVPRPSIIAGSKETGLYLIQLGLKKKSKNIQDQGTITNHKRKAVPLSFRPAKKKKATPAKKKAPPVAPVPVPVQAQENVIDLTGSDQKPPPIAAVSAVAITTATIIAEKDLPHPRDDQTEKEDSPTAVVPVPVQTAPAVAPVIRSQENVVNHSNLDRKPAAAAGNLPMKRKLVFHSQSSEVHDFFKPKQRGSHPSAVPQKPVVSKPPAKKKSKTKVNYGAKVTVNHGVDIRSFFSKASKRS